MEVEDKNTQVREGNTQLQERDTQINRQQRELAALRVRTAGQGYCVVVVMSSILSLNVIGGQEEATGRSGGEGHSTPREKCPTAATRSRTPRKGHTAQQTTERATNTEGK